VPMLPEELSIKRELLRELLAERWNPEPLDEHSWEFQHVAGWMPLCCYAEINPEMEAFLFRAINPLTVEPEKIPLVNEYLARVNYQLPIGGWAIDMDRGEVRWKSGVYFGGTDLNEALMRHVIESSLHFIKRYIFGLAHIQTGGTVESALQTVGEDKGKGKTEGAKQPG